MKRTALSLISLAIVISILSAAWIGLDMRRYLNHSISLVEDTIYSIPPGLTLSAISRDLQKAGIITRPLYFVCAARLKRMENRIKAGEYVIPADITPLQLLGLFVEGKVKQYSLVLIEGWTFSEVIDAVNKHPAVEKTLTDASPETIMTALGLPELSPEGQFFPDTYHFPRGTTDLSFLQRAHQRLQTVLTEEWEQRAENLPYVQAYDALIMASLVEKETALPQERDMIAGVFVRRLDKGMRLQTDPTVIYAMGQTFDGNIRRKDLDIDSPYNTYRYAGLPPTPIALPGREAIHAALHPREGKELYFVATGDGGHHFSVTLMEHNEAVRKYQLKK